MIALPATTQQFLRDMVYGESPDFKTALATVSALADRLKE